MHWRCVVIDMDDAIIEKIAGGTCKCFSSTICPGVTRAMNQAVPSEAKDAEKHADPVETGPIRSLIQRNETRCLVDLFVDHGFYFWLWE